MGMKQLNRKWVIPDSRGRITIPEYMRKALGMSDEPLLIEVYPDLENTKSLIIRKGY